MVYIFRHCGCKLTLINIEFSIIKFGSYFGCQGTITAMEATPPHVLTQCRCFNTIQVLTDDIVGLYAQVRATVYNEVYTAINNTKHPFINETIDSCSAQNQALIWLSSGNVRDGGDLYQRYILALLYIRMK